MGRMIINYSDDIPAASVPLYIQAVINGGRLSAKGECYCYATVFKDNTVCIADITEKGTDVFRLFKEKNDE